MKIYTKTGDTGETSLANGSRRSKNDRRMNAVGALDECSAAIGMLLAMSVTHDRIDRDLLESAQGNLLFIGAIAAAANEAVLTKGHDFGKDDVVTLEQRIDQLEQQLAPLRQFILPGGTAAAAAAHLARTICRRAERRLVAITGEVDSPYWPTVLSYINRLSDYLFVLARTYNRLADIEDVVWKSE